jgi:hypothetical protein
LALEATHPAGRRDQLEATLKWLLDTAERKVPPRYRESFLWQNPINQKILETAKQQGIA